MLMTGIMMVVDATMAAIMMATAMMATGMIVTAGIGIRVGTVAITGRRRPIMARRLAITRPHPCITHPRRSITRRR